MNKEQTIHAFWSSFGLKAYDENSVPENVQFPYITYDVAVDDFDSNVALNASLWYWSSSWADITAKEQEISDFITRGGRMLAYDDGALWIRKSTPWAQRFGESSDDMIRRIILSVIVEYLD